MGTCRRAAERSELLRHHGRVQSGQDSRQGRIWGGGARARKEQSARAIRCQAGGRVEDETKGEGRGQERDQAARKLPPPEHRALSRFLRRGRPPAHRNGFCRGRRSEQPAQGAGHAPPTRGPGARLLCADLPRDEARARPQGAAPRHQIAERLPHAEPACDQAGRLWHRACSNGDGGDGEDLVRHAVLHEPGDLRRQVVQ